MKKCHKITFCNTGINESEVNGRDSINFNICGVKDTKFFKSLVAHINFPQSVDTRVSHILSTNCSLNNHSKAGVDPAYCYNYIHIHTMSRQ